MRVAFFGLPLAALLLMRDGHEVVLASICRPDGLGIRRLRRLLGAEKFLLKPDVSKARFQKKLEDSAPDLVVSWFWTKRLPVQVLHTARLGAIGVHPSLLPRHRGPDPYFWAIDSGDAYTGVTAHRLEEEYDTGAVIAQRTLAIENDWNAWILAKKLDRPSLALLREVTLRLSRGERLGGDVQDETKVTLAPEPDPRELELCWRWDASRIERRVRAASPYPGTFTQIGDELVTITRVRNVATFPKALRPGEAAVVVGEGGKRIAVVRAKEGALELVEGRIDRDDAPAITLARADFVRIVELARERNGDPVFEPT